MRVNILSLRAPCQDRSGFNCFENCLGEIRAGPGYLKIYSIERTDKFVRDPHECISKCFVIVCLDKDQ